MRWESSGCSPDLGKTLSASGERGGTAHRSDYALTPDTEGTSNQMTLSLKKIAIGLMAVVAMTFGLPASPAMAISQVSCGSRNDFLKLHIDFGAGYGFARCFANGGVTAVNIDGVYRFDTGNNKATLNYERDGRYYSTTLDKWRGSDFGGARVRVYEVRIW
ncbi:beta/gamma crystallin domain-containing protein [Micromonospora sp. LOL_023]|uniref:beta/gamma crystallin domain-containing protein n=1 Tax=Micromonospora sp. LOL_023 TaxID=3345418 RepID=UPI003A84122A